MTHAKPSFLSFSLSAFCPFEYLSLPPSLSLPLSRSRRSPREFYKDFTLSSTSTAGSCLFRLILIPGIKGARALPRHNAVPRDCNGRGKWKSSRFPWWDFRWITKPGFSEYFKEMTGTVLFYSYFNSSPSFSPFLRLVFAQF